MKGDIILVEPHHINASKKIVGSILPHIKESERRFVITVAGESGSGKSETARAIANELEAASIQSIVLGQDDYFELPPKSNDAMRRDDPEWLGPHIEVKMDVLEQNLVDAISGVDVLVKPVIDYGKNETMEEEISLAGVKVVIAEGTYTSLLKHVDTKVFIARNRFDTLEHRQKRNRGTEVGDPFVEGVLAIEHKIIAGHRFLADFIINKDYSVKIVSPEA